MKRTTTRRRRAPGVLSERMVRRLEVALHQTRGAAAELLEEHARQVDKLSQRLQVVVAEVDVLAELIRKARV